MSSVQGSAGSAQPYPQPGNAMAVATVGFCVALGVVMWWPSLWSPPLGAPAWVDPLLDLAVISLPLVVAVVLAAPGGAGRTIARTTGLVPWTWLDLLFGLLVGVAARAAVELVAPTGGSLVALGGPGAPSGQMLATAITLLGVVLVSPLIEELFFRGLVQRVVAGVTAEAGVLGTILAIVVSTSSFVLIHAVAYGPAVPVAALVGTTLTGIGCGVLVAATGRLGGAITAHVVFNLGGVLLLG